jgi:hypothetical protein
MPCCRSPAAKPGPKREVDVARRFISRLPVVLLTCALMAALAVPALAVSNARLTNDATANSYVRYDGGTDATLTACSTGRRPQNEPTVAVNPHDTDVITAGANDYCQQTVDGDVWAGYYRSTDGGSTWTNSLVPGYPTDASPAGSASPTTGVCSAAGDPTQSFDNDGRLFYGFICFNRAKPSNGSIYVATYENDGADYARTTRVVRGTPSVWGVFNDKVNLVVDQTSGARSGTIYIGWVRYPGQSANNVLEVARSTDHGVTWSKPVKVSQGHGEEQFADLAVGPDGSLYVTWRTFAHQTSTSTDIWVATSTNGAQTFSPPVRIASSISPFDGDAFDPAGACGDGPFACASGLTYPRFASLSAVTADASGVHVVWNARLPSGQSKVFVRNSPDGLTWPSAAFQLDTAAAGHQWWPDIASADGTITAVFNDSRTDPAYSPDRPSGNTAAGVNSGNVVHTVAARSTDGGLTWTEATATSAGSNLNWEQFGSRRSSFMGDYIYVSAVPGRVVGAWTDTRDVLPGTDPREAGADDDADGFDVLQPGCVYVPNDINAPVYSSPLISDPCLSQGGLDSNIYGGDL